MLGWVFRCPTPSSLLSFFLIYISSFLRCTTIMVMTIITMMKMMMMNTEEKAPHKKKREQRRKGFLCFGQLDPWITTWVSVDPLICLSAMVLVGHGKHSPRPRHLHNYICRIFRIGSLPLVWKPGPYLDHFLVLDILGWAFKYTYSQTRTI